MAASTKRYIADPHFGHASIIKNCARPFSSTEEMDAEIVRRWNSVVQPHDVTYVIGDYGRLGKNGDLRSFHQLFNALNGQKYLILGNHDLGPDGRVLPEIVKLGWAEPPTSLMEVHDDGRHVVLCHYAMRVWPGSHRGSIHFYGHSHARLPGHGLSRDVGVDMPDVDFTPRTFNELTKGWDFSNIAG